MPTLSTTPHRFRTSAAALLGLLLLVLAGIVAALLLRGGGDTRTAFAQAAPGDYAIITRPVGETTDAVLAIPINPPGDQTGEPIQVARIERLPGYALSGAVSPDGSKAALVLPDAGTIAHPVARLVVVDLITGDVTALAPGVEELQKPVWTPDSNAVLATTRDAEGLVSLRSYALDGTATDVLAVDGAFGVYPVGHLADGTLVSVVIADDGSSVWLGASEQQVIADGFTRDWSLEPGSGQLAYIEVLTTDGVAYEPRVIALTGADAAPQMQMAAGLEALGTAWTPEGQLAFGGEPSVNRSETSGGAMQLAADGFDIPLSYTAGGALAVEHYDGTSFDEPGTRDVQIVTGDGRTSLSSEAHFLGWGTP